MTDDPERLADFWSAALDLPERRTKPEETIIADTEWRYPRLTFQKVSRTESRPRRLHLDLTADDRIAEVARLQTLGASAEREVNSDGGWMWTVMTDPGGNEFCVTDA